jgi:flagellar assembly factor FliW
MNTVETIELEPLAVRSENIVHLPLGLLGFERIKRYVLLENPHEAPFRWLQVLGDASLAFLVIPPTQIFPDYEPDIAAEDVELLQLASSEDALLLNIVTLRGKNRATVNLKGPIVVNRSTLVGKQIVPVNSAGYSLQQSLPTRTEV